MDLARKLEVLDKQISDANAGRPSNFDLWRNETEVALRAVMGEDSPQVEKFIKVRYTAGVYYSGMDTSGYRPAGVRRGIAILESAKTELTLRAEIEEVVQTGDSLVEKASAAESGRVFIVHGHDGERKHELARLLRSLTGAEPIILHEQPNAGRVLLEKLEHYAASTGFAVALLTADDRGRARDVEGEADRARQNVVFEAGYFAGALGRSKLAILHEDGVELPSDLHGLVYVTLDKGGAWKGKVAHELSNAGIPVDWSALGAG